MSARRAAAALIAALALALPTAASAAPAQTRPQDVPVPVGGPDPALSGNLDSVMAISPEDTCLTVTIDGTPVYDHRGTDLQTPASTEKLLTTSAALDRLGPDDVLTTRLVTAAPVTDGVVGGDVVLVGGGDAGLITSLYRAVRHQPADQTATLVDDLVSQLRRSGVRRIAGRVLGDDQRYDDLRTVPSWPDRYVRQEQAGPLGALTVDDGYLLEPGDDGHLDRRRSDAPDVDAARALTALLAARGIVVDGQPGRGSAPPGGRDLASVASPPLRDLVGDILRRSDNQAAELLAKELGRAAEGSGSTAAGARTIAAWATDHGVAAPGSVVVDGSGLDPGNRLTCQELVGVLDASGGRRGPIAAGLPVAGRSGTLAGRFHTSSARGVLRAKTGSLNGVSALAGFVDLPDGGTATFAYIANGDGTAAKARRAEDFLAAVLASYRPPCPAHGGRAVVAPILGPATVLASLSGPIVPLAVPGAAAALAAVAAHPAAVLDRCSAAAGSRAMLAPGVAAR